MRFKTIILALNLSALAAVSHAQMLTPTNPAGGAPVAAPTTAAIPVTAASQAAATAAPAASGPLAPGVVSLADVARQSNGQPAPAPVGAQPNPVPAITLVDGTGQPIQVARDKMRRSPDAAVAPRRNDPFYLVRISRVGGDDTAVLWIKGQHRKVTTGSRVLKYAVGEIKDDGVCIYLVKAKVKDKCKTLLTFEGM